MKIKLGIILCLILLNLQQTIEIRAQEYVIGPEDVLTISFWQQPELNSTARVSQNGTIVLPVIGNMTAAGLTPSALAQKIADKISLFNKKISQAAVVVTQYGSKKVYVAGHVLQPGKYAFEVIPDLWKIILEAGGPAETAILTQVKIVRGGRESGKSETVDLAKYLADGDASQLPPIYPGDTINIPGINPDVTGAEPGAAAMLTSASATQDAFYIYGQVISPGGYPLTKNLNVLEAIIMAGGPAPQAKMDEVKVIIRGESYSSIATLDLKKYARSGLPAPFNIKPGDTIFIPEKRQSVFAAMGRRGIFYDILRVAVTATTSMLIYNLLR